MSSLFVFVQRNAAEQRLVKSVAVPYKHHSVTSKHRHADMAYLQRVIHTSRPHSRCGFSALSIALYIKQVPVNIRSKPRHPGKTDEFWLGPEQETGWLMFGTKILKTTALRELCKHSSKTSQSICINNYSALFVIIKVTLQWNCTYSTYKIKHWFFLLCAL